MGVYKRGDTWGISYFHNGKRIRRTIGTNKGEWGGICGAFKSAILREGGI